MASTLALPVGWYVLPSGAVLTGTALGAGFDAAGQLIGGNEYRPGQMVIAGVTGGLTYPLAGGGLLSSMALGGIYGGSNRVLNNYVYDEDKSVVDSTVFGMAGGGLGYGIDKTTSYNFSKILPVRIGGEVIDPNKPILLQNIGILNPYPTYIGKSAGQVTETIVPLVLERQEVKHD